MHGKIKRSIKSTPKEANFFLCGGGEGEVRFRMRNETKHIVFDFRYFDIHFFSLKVFSALYFF